MSGQVKPGSLDVKIHVHLESPLYFNAEKIISTKRINILILKIIIKIYL